MNETKKNTVGMFLEPEYVSNLGIYKGTGVTEDDLSRPVIGIANAFNEMVPGHLNLRELAEQVKYGVYRAGGTPLEFGVVSCCDGIATGHCGGNYVLPSREVIADSVEIEAMAHQLDGLVLMASCDKIVPAMLMAAARLDIPCIFINGGCMMGGPPFRHIPKADASTVTEALGMYQAKQISKEELMNLTTTCTPTAGSGQFLGTANTMCCLSEALGMTLPGAAAIPAPYHERRRIALQSGEKIVELVKKGITAREILNENSIKNAIMVLMAIGGSTNAVLHLTAVGNELGIPPEKVMGWIEEYSKKIPQIVSICPASRKDDMEEFYYAGGVPEVMKRLAECLYTENMTASGLPLSENLKNYVNLYDHRNDMIHSMDDPVSTLAGIAVMHGNLAPNTGISKAAGIAECARRFQGTAICFDCEEDCLKAIGEDRIHAGHVVVVRYEGPKGGPGMREMFKVTKMLHGMGLATNTAVITDGRFSGTNSGCFVGHISPEAADGGPIALVKDGDQILIDVDQGVLELLVSQEELDARRAAWKYQPKKRKGYLARYALLAKSADQGAVLRET